ncbi:MAG: DMT family transporter [Balneolaceae bacterium]
MIKNRRIPLTDVALFCIAFIWALNFSVIKASLSEIEPYSFNSARFILATLLVWGIVFWKKAWFTIPKKDWVPLIFIGLIGNLLYQWLFIVGIDLTLSANAAVMLGTIPIWIAIFSHFFSDEQMSWLKFMGVTLAFVGVAAIILGGENSLNFASDTFTGDVIIVLAAITWAIYTIRSKNFLKDYTPLQFSAMMTLVGAISLTIISFFVAGSTNWNEVSVPAYGGVIYSGALSIGLAYLIWNNGIVKVGPVKTSVYQNLVPVLGVIFGIILLNESLSSLQYLGSAITVAGVVITRKSK